MKGEQFLETNTLPNNDFENKIMEVFEIVWKRPTTFKTSYAQNEVNKIVKLFDVTRMVAVRFKNYNPSLFIVSWLATRKTA